MKTATHKLEDRIQNRQLWPWFDRPAYLNELNELADDMTERNSIEGYLGATLVYHQLAEEIVKMILEYNDFFLRACIHPAELPDRKSVDRKMFGGLVDELTQAVEFEGKSGMIQLLKTLNKFRITLVHNLTASDSLDSVRDQVTEISHLFRRIYEYFYNAIQWYGDRLAAISRDDYWENLNVSNLIE